MSELPAGTVVEWNVSHYEGTIQIRVTDNEGENYGVLLRPSDALDLGETLAEMVRGRV